MADAVKLVTPRYAATLDREAPGPQLRNVSTRNWGADNYGALWERISMQMKHITTGEDMAVDTCLASSFGMFRKQLCAGLLTARSGSASHAWPAVGPGLLDRTHSPPSCGGRGQPPCSLAPGALSSWGAPSTMRAGGGGPGAGVPPRRWFLPRPPSSERLTTRPRTRPAGPSQGWPALATGPARPARKIGPSGA
jgi:hypothetical protein